MNRWTDETEQMVARLIHEYGGPCGCEQFDNGDLVQARKALAVLADAGLLVPANSKAEEEWAYPVGPDDNRRMIATWLRDPVIPGMSKRTVITTPWTEVEPTTGSPE